MSQKRECHQRLSLSLSVSRSVTHSRSPLSLCLSLSLTLSLSGSRAGSRPPRLPLRILPLLFLLTSLHLYSHSAHVFYPTANLQMTLRQSQALPAAIYRGDSHPDAFPTTARAIHTVLVSPIPTADHSPQYLDGHSNTPRDAFYILLPLLIVLSTFLFLLLLFLVCVIILRRRRGIMLRDHDGPIDMSREDLVEGEGGFDNLESRWLESVSDTERRMYDRAKRTLFSLCCHSSPASSSPLSL